MARQGHELCSAQGQRHWLLSLLRLTTRTVSAQIWALVAVSPTLISVSIWSLVIKSHRFPHWPQWGETKVVSGNSGKLNVYLGISFPRCRNQRPRKPLSAQGHAGLGEKKFIQNQSVPLNILITPSGSLESMEVFQPHSWGSGSLAIMSCLWIVASWSSCEGQGSQKWPMLPFWWYQFKNCDLEGVYRSY